MVFGPWAIPGDPRITEPPKGECEPVEEECVFCGEPRGPHEFQDGLRCVYCAETQDEEE